MPDSPPLQKGPWSELQWAKPEQIIWRSQFDQLPALRLQIDARVPAALKVWSAQQRNGARLRPGCQLT